MLRLFLDAVALEARSGALLLAAGSTANGAAEALRDTADRPSEAVRGLADGAAQSLCGVADSVAEALSGGVEAVAEALGGAADGTGHASEETALALGLLTAGEDVVDTTEQTAEKTSVVRHFDYVGEFLFLYVCVESCL